MVAVVLICASHAALHITLFIPVCREGLDRRMPFVRMGSVLCILMGFATFFGYYLWVEGRQVGVPPLVASLLLFTI